eukprot:scaffold59035_cov63-Phaeocystis_antarctica.AAC.8
MRGARCRTLVPVRIEQAAVGLQHVQAQLVVIQTAQKVIRYKQCTLLLWTGRPHLGLVLVPWEGDPRVEVALARMFVGAQHATRHPAPSQHGPKAANASVAARRH